jgi:hypothetical protein
VERRLSVRRTRHEVRDELSHLSVLLPGDLIVKNGKLDDGSRDYAGLAGDVRALILPNRYNYSRIAIGVSAHSIYGIFSSIFGRFILRRANLNLKLKKAAHTVQGSGASSFKAAALLAAAVPGRAIIHVISRYYSWCSLVLILP